LFILQVSTLLANHARVDVFDLEGRSALHLAAEHGYINVCDALLEHKAFINSKSRIGYTALHMAAQNGYTMLVKSLIKEHSAVIDVLTLASLQLKTSYNELGIIYFYYQ
jgi:ankyrin repeat protein